MKCVVFLPCNNKIRNFDLGINYFLTGFMVHFKSGAPNFLFVKFYINCIFSLTIREGFEKMKCVVFLPCNNKIRNFDLGINYFLTGFMVYFNRGQQIFYS
jgi:hypothetical protein